MLLRFGHVKNFLACLKAVLGSDRLLVGALLCFSLLGVVSVLYVMVVASGNPSPQFKRDEGRTALSSFEAAFVPAVGPKPAPHRAFLNAQGSLETFSDHHGRMVLVNLWATWCGPCIQEMPSLDRLQGKLGGPGFEVMALSLDNGGLSVAAAFFEKLGIKNLDLYNDASFGIARDFNTDGLPTSILLNGQGLEIGRITGPAEWDSQEAIRFLSEFVGQARAKKTL